MLEAIIARLPRVLKLENPVFGEIGNDANATVQGVVVTALAFAVGILTAGGNVVGNILIGLIVSPILLFGWTAILYVVGKMFGGQGTYAQLIRPIGYAGAPFALRIVPVIGGPAGLLYSAVIQIRAVMQINQVKQGSAIAAVVISLGLGGVITLAILATLGD
jgi:hypothetical protein